MKYSLLSSFALLVVPATASSSSLGKQYTSNQYYHVECETLTPANCRVLEGKASVDGGVSHAYGMFNDEISKDGWGKLWIHGDESTQGYYEAGFLVRLVLGELLVVVCVCRRFLSHLFV